MSRRRVIELPHARHAAPIPTAVMIGNVLATSAIFGADPSSGKVPEALEDEVACLFANITAVLELAGASAADVLKMDVLLRESGYRSLINQHWLALFPDPADRPARHITVVPNLPARAQIEFMAVLHPLGDHGVTS
jgi:2-iminobutanoate/2-iminopropanoate deaminase